MTAQQKHKLVEKGKEGMNLLGNIMTVIGVPIIAYFMADWKSWREKKNTDDITRDRQIMEHYYSIENIKKDVYILKSEGNIKNDTINDPNS